MQEQWQRWEPVQGLARKYYIIEITDTVKGLNFILYDYDKPESRISVNFYDNVDSYRVIDESFRLATFQSLRERYGSSFHTEWTFFKINNSSYIEWLSQQSYGISNSMDFIHFCFISVDSVADIITSYEPEIIFL